MENRWNEKERRREVEDGGGAGEEKKQEEEEEEEEVQEGGRRGPRSLCTLTTVGTGRGDRSNANRSFENRSASTGGSNLGDGCSREIDYYRWYGVSARSLLPGNEFIV